MKYDFDKVYDRKSALSSKWSVEEIFGRDDVLPLWVADMDFRVPEPVLSAIRERLDHPIFGYTMVSPSFYDSAIQRLDSKYGWKVDKEWIVITPGVMPAVNAAVLAFTGPGDKVVLQSPVYPPFWTAITHNKRELAVNPLKLSDTRFEIDFEDFKAKFDEGGARAFILCNPHNPGGRVWTRDELITMGETVIGAGGVVISDEIHCELVMKGHSHIPFASISEEFAMNSVICFAPSKTFNIPGFHTSVTIIPNETLRRRFNEARGRLMGAPGIFGLIAAEAAFRYGDDWLEQVLEYIEGNINYAVDFLNKNVPEIRPMRPEATYLIWLDCRGLGLDQDALRRFLIEEARVGLNDGTTFGPEGTGFMRLNVACPRSILEEALVRIENAVKVRRGR